MTSNGASSHKDMWDDSVLVDSWNDALEEYKQYHSLQARGENTKDVLKTDDIREQKTSATNGEDEVDYEENVVKQPSLDQPPQAELPGETDDQNINKVKLTANHNPSAEIGTNSKPPALPQHLVGQVHDEGLKHLLMSWYYAGYYTGLYEGQHQKVDAKH